LGGKGAERLQLKGEVEREDFVALVRNRVPGSKGQDRLTARNNTTREEWKLDACSASHGKGQTRRQNAREKKPGRAYQRRTTGGLAPANGSPTLGQPEPRVYPFIASQVHIGCHHDSL
jgi:hypothetical protein